jgi:hypothetical protein
MSALEVRRVDRPEALRQRRADRPSSTNRIIIANQVGQELTLRNTNI